MTWTTATGAPGCDGYRRHGGHAGLAPQIPRQPLERGAGFRRAHLGHQQQRAVEAGAEALRQQIVGLASGRRRGIVAGVGKAQPQSEERDRRARA